MAYLTFIPTTPFLPLFHTKHPIPKPHPIKTKPNLANLRLTTSPPTSTQLQTFTEKVKGEWTGYEANFNPQTGIVQPLPDYYIPESFLEWGQIPLGFESTHSITVRDTTLFLKFFRILPTVSLFADHVDLEESLHRHDLLSPGATIFPDGSFALGPALVSAHRKSLLDKIPSVTLCLHDPREGKRRLLHVNLQFDFASQTFANHIRVIREEYSCMYCDGADIEGSSGFVDGWASGPAGSPDKLEGMWVKDGKHVSRKIAPPVEGKRLYLPGGVDVGVAGLEEGCVGVHAGWLVDAETRVVLRRVFGKDGCVMTTERVVERRV